MWRTRTRHTVASITRLTSQSLAMITGAATSSRASAAVERAKISRSRASRAGLSVTTRVIRWS